MSGSTVIKCACGNVAMELTGQPIMTVECMCDSCRKAGALLAGLPGAPPVLDDNNATLHAMYRKDRVRCVSGEDNLREFRLEAKSKTRRVVAACCNSAMFLDFTSGHWLDIYGRRWPQTTMPKPEMRTMTSDLPPGTNLPDDIANVKAHSFKFFAKLMVAWVAMRFRTPRINYVHGELNVR